MGAGRRFSLYRSVAPMTDYIVEFKRPRSFQEPGWVVRVSDTRNYYGLRLELAKSGPMSEVELVRFAGGGRRTGRGEEDTGSRWW